MEFRLRKKAQPGAGDLGVEQETGTPEETLESAYLKIRSGIASELLTRIKAGSPQFFERLVVELLLAMGYGGSRKAGRPDIQKFVGALHGKRARKGAFITTGSFSSEASEYVAHIDPKVVLIEGRQLAELMIDFGVGVTSVANYEVKRVDSDYFGEEESCLPRRGAAARKVLRSIASGESG